MENPNVSYKNILQEYFQAKHLKIPQYETITVNTTQPFLFRSTVVLPSTYGSYTGGSYTQKKMAELSSAQTALIALNIMPKDTSSNSDKSLAQEQTSDEEVEKYPLNQLFVFDWTIHNPIIILNDNENVNKLSYLESFITNYQLDNVKLIKISSHLSNSKKNANYVIDSSNKDVADHFITYLVGLLTGTVMVPFKIIVLTGDHFGGALEDIMKYNPNVYLKHTTCQDDCIKLLQTLIPDLHL
jgi:hypothetical protein